MELIDLVSELLYKHNCVIIPNFGGFVANFKPAEFEENRLLLSPSRKKVAFNQSLIENDALLINALVTRKSIDYEQAEKEVLLFSKFLADRLEKYKNYEFKNIGSFYLNKEGKMIFVAYEGLNFYKKSYGLQDVKVHRLASKPAPKMETPSVSKEKIAAISRPQKRRFVYLPQVAAAVFIMALFGIALWQLLQTTGKQQPIVKHEVKVESDSPQQANLIPNIGLDEAVAETELKDSETETAPYVNTPVIEEVTDKLIESGKLPKPSSGTENNTNQINQTSIDLEALYNKAMAKEKVFYVAVAKFTQSNEVGTLIQKLHKKEYQTFEMSEKNGTKHLCLEKFLNENNAKTFLNLVKKYDEKKAYILVLEE